MNLRHTDRAQLRQCVQTGGFLPESEWKGIKPQMSQTCVEIPRNLRSHHVPLTPGPEARAQAFWNPHLRGTV